MTEKFIFDNGVHVRISDRQKYIGFEILYLTLREKEGRLSTLEEIKQLPHVSESNPDHALWKLRQKSISRFLTNLKGKERELNILEVGCGNGFLSNLMAQAGHSVTGLDVNLHELKQAAAAFGQKKLTWICAEIMQDLPGGEKFDLIVLPSSLQYFADPGTVIDRCLELLNDGGEIHIFDTPFYKAAEREKAREASISHFRKLDVGPMRQHYHHHSAEFLGAYRHEFLYKPKGRIWQRFFPDTPFPWIVITGSA